MKKKTYNQPKTEVVEIEQTDIICTSTETLGDGGNIFGAKGSYFDLDEEDDIINY